MNKLQKSAIFQNTKQGFLPGKVLGIHHIVKERGEGERFKVIQTASGSLFQALLAPNERLVARVGSIVSSFGQADTSIRTFQSLGESIKRRFAGGSFYLEEFVAEKQATLLLGSTEPGDVAILTLNATEDFIFRSESFLALSGDIKLSISPSGFGLGDSGFFFAVASGTGTVALSKGGSGLVAVKLDANQTMNVNPRNVVAWESSMSYNPVVSDAIPSSKRVIWKNLVWMTEKRIPFRHAAEATLFYFHSIVGSVVHLFRYWVIGERGLYRYIGPGQIFISTTRSK